MNLANSRKGSISAGGARAKNRHSSAGAEHMPALIQPLGYASNASCATNSLNTSVGVRKPKHFRGVAFMRWARTVSSSAVLVDTSRSSGRKRRRRPLVFSTVPFCQGADQAGHDVGRVPAGISADEQIPAAPLHERRDVVFAEHLPEGHQVAFPMAEGGALADLGRALTDRIDFGNVQSSGLPRVACTPPATLARKMAVELLGAAGWPVNIAIFRRAITWAAKAGSRCNLAVRRRRMALIWCAAMPK